jgi:flagellin
MNSLSTHRDYGALHALETNARARDRSLQSLASGKREALSPAEQALATHLLTQADGLQQAVENTESAANVTQTAQGALSEVNDRVRDINRLAVAAANTGVYDAHVQQALQAQVASNLQSIQNFASQTQFNGQNLLDGSHASPTTAIPFQIGADAGQTVNATLGDARTATLGTGVVANRSLADIDVTSAAGAADAIEIARAARVQVSQQNAQLGALEANTLQPTVRALQHRISAAQESASRLADTDYGAETVKAISRQIIVQSGLAAISQATIDRRRALVLLR